MEPKPEPGQSGSTLPAHPRGLEWKYFATVDDTDPLLGDDRLAIRAALEADDSFIAPRLIRHIRE
jgi:hypothetical protein